MAKNPYTLLGVKKTASEGDIRQAYRKLAKKYHPDVNPGDVKAEDKFKEITAAYNLLSDKDLKAQYDSGQVDGAGQQRSPFGRNSTRARRPFQTGFGGMEGMRGQDDMADLFSSLFGLNMGNMRRAQNHPQKGADVRYEMKLPFLDALRGGIQTLDGNLKVKIPRGVKSGQVLRLKGKGQAGQYGGPKGDAKVEIVVLPHKNLLRKGNNLYLKLPISLSEAVLGAKIKINMPSGVVKVSLPVGTNSGKKMRLKGKGIKDGDLVLEAQIILTAEELSFLSKLDTSLIQSSGDDLRRNLI